MITPQEKASCIFWFAECKSLELFNVISKHSTRRKHGQEKSFDERVKIFNAKANIRFLWYHTLRLLFLSGFTKNIVYKKNVTSVCELNVLAKLFFELHWIFWTVRVLNWTTVLISCRQLKEHISRSNNVWY